MSFVRAAILLVLSFGVPIARSQSLDLIQHLERSIAEAEKKGDSQALADSLSEVSGQYALLGKSREAIAAAQRALTFSDKVENSGFEFWAYSGLSTAYAVLKDNQKAEEYARLAQIRQQPMVIARLVTGIDPGEFKDLEESLAFETSRHNEKGEALALFNLGNAYFIKNDVPKALSYWEPAVPLYRKLDDWLHTGTVLNSIAKSQDSLEQHEDAAKSWRAAADVFIANKAYPMALDSLNNLAQSYYAESMYPEAGAALDEALALRQRAGLTADADELDLSIAVDIHLGAKDKARTRTQQLLQLCRAKGDTQCVQTMTNALAQLAGK